MVVWVNSSNGGVGGGKFISTVNEGLKAQDKVHIGAVCCGQYHDDGLTTIFSTHEIVSHRSRFKTLAMGLNSNRSFFF